MKSSIAPLRVDKFRCILGTWTYQVCYGLGVVRYEKSRRAAYAFAKAYAEKLKAREGQPRG